ncbi:MAG: hypothetical protein WC505_06250 [Patescibacteria group bacterium]
MVIKEAFIALLDARDFLAYQYSHELGLMTDEQLEEIVQEYPVEVPHTQIDLAARAAVLWRLLGDRFDTEVASVMLRCTFEQAVKAMEGLL